MANSTANVTLVKTKGLVVGPLAGRASPEGCVSMSDVAVRRDGALQTREGYYSYMTVPSGLNTRMGKLEFNNPTGVCYRRETGSSYGEVYVVDTDDAGTGFRITVLSQSGTFYYHMANHFNWLQTPKHCCWSTNNYTGTDETLLHMLTADNAYMRRYKIGGTYGNQASTGQLLGIDNASFGGAQLWEFVVHTTTNTLVAEVTNDVIAPSTNGFIISGLTNAYGVQIIRDTTVYTGRRIYVLLCANNQLTVYQFEWDGTSWANIASSTCSNTFTGLRDVAALNTTLFNQDVARSGTLDLYLISNTSSTVRVQPLTITGSSTWGLPSNFTWGTLSDHD